MKRKYQVLDLFSGCGGISVGFQRAGFKIHSAIDFDADSISTFNTNFPSSNGIVEDLASYTKVKIRRSFDSSKNKIDVVVGGPPCQGFSNANRWQTEIRDPRNKLFFEYLRFIEVLQPKVLLVENVPGIFSRGRGYTVHRIHELISDLGYTVSSSILNAAEFGVPQNRRRAFIIGIREDLSHEPFDFTSLKRQSPVNVGEAIKDLYNLENKPGSSHRLNVQEFSPSSDYSKFVKSSRKFIENHEVVYPAESTQIKISYVPQGGNWMDIPEKLFSSNRKNRHSSAFKRLNEKEPSVTIDTGNAHSNYFHPKFNRIPTVREAARIQSFPDNFIFVGSRTSQYRQVGNAVPPLLAFRIAKQILRLLEK